MAYYKEFCDEDYENKAVRQLNDLSKEHDVEVISYQIARDETNDFGKRYILVKVN
ncbi:hypothetical protein RD055328_08600 [Companilactobacillus sp. RD055328]|uniref:hypothetical protein n=1 Tax=Companilactobacillus sp. RD055328 TaxID=2916634 RepID=UPI001FC8C70E|nr:hypothetical protein [Companilactobacillus sp. RD055328]GKQ42937.1 hypothetical protein RD055328_08600 [Companilactobacillus sp. RD055328]